ncbi:hypothetical protein [Cytobacillus firmus]|uniref:hypothetical protein n=1 Tax=Cytobacillus firmus TaxID=1399 RepID=UPI00216180BB|nr:hypothetical protein [Cytobacillus firmus]
MDLPILVMKIMRVVLFVDNKEIFTGITTDFWEELLDKSEFTNISVWFDPFIFLPQILKAIEKLNRVERK